MCAQQALPLILPSFDEHDLVIGTSNALVYQVLMEHEPLPSHLMVLYGEQGSGKSTLAYHWAMKYRASLFLQPLSVESLAHLKQGNYVLDGYPEDKESETFMFHLINIIKETDSHLLICSEKAPNHLDITLPDLRSRMNSAYAIRLMQPDDEMLHALFIKQLAEKQLRPAPQVIDYLLKRMPRSFNAVVDTVRQLDVLSLQNQRPITIHLARELLEKCDIAA